MNDLETILRKETECLRLAYLNRTEDYAFAIFKLASERYRWSDEQWANYLGVETEIKNPGSNIEFVGFKRNFYNTSAAREYSKLKKTYYSIIASGYDKYLMKELKYAELHYEKSLHKLISRVESKGLIVDNIKIKSNSIDVNINLILTDGEKSVKAWTIVAEGPIQRPHYRYLVK